MRNRDCSSSRLSIKLLLNTIEQLLIDDRVMLPFVDKALVRDAAEVDWISQQVERARRG